MGKTHKIRDKNERIYQIFQKTKKVFAYLKICVIISDNTIIPK